MVYNVHERVISATPDQVWSVLVRLPDLWPAGHGSFVLPEGLHEGAPVDLAGTRCRIGTLEPCRRIWFDMGRAMPDGHGFIVNPVKGGTHVRHEVNGRLGPVLKVLWPLFIRRKHNLVLELLLDNLVREVTHAHAS